MSKATSPIIEIKNLSNYLGGHWVHRGLNLTVDKGEILAIIGGSGCGKTTLLRSILMLLRPNSGTIKVCGKNIMHLSAREEYEVQKRWGVMFQGGALFSSLTVLENVLFAMRTYRHLSRAVKKQIALLKIVMTGLEVDAAAKYPAELSGGMVKRASLARAIALDPEMLFLDEPSAGLDPKSAGELDQLILKLRETLNLTIVMVTHDLDSLWTVPDKVAFLGEGKVLACKPMRELVKEQQPLIQSYFSGPRGQLMRDEEAFFDGQ